MRVQGDPEPGHQLVAVVLQSRLRMLVAAAVVKGFGVVAVTAEREEAGMLDRMTIAINLVYSTGQVKDYQRSCVVVL